MRFSSVWKKRPARKDSLHAQRTRKRTVPPRLEVLEDRTLLNAGDLDPTFGVGGTVLASFPPSNDFPRAVTVQADGTPVVLGDSAIGGGVYQDIAHYTTTGSLDNSSTYSQNTSGQEIVFVEVDGKIVTAGVAYNQLVMYRYNSDLSLDTTFGVGGSVTQTVNGIANLNGVAVESSGQFVLTGEDAAGIFVARLNQDGSLDTTFSGTGITYTNVGLDSSGNSVAVQADGKLVVAGWETGPAGNALQGIVLRYNLDGSLDTSFGAGRPPRTFSLFYPLYVRGVGLGRTFST